MLLVSSGSTIPFRIPEKQAHFCRANNPEPGLQSSSEKLIYRFMEMFEPGEVIMGRKFLECELHPQSQGVSSTLPGGEGGHHMRAECRRWPRLFPWAVGFCTLKVPEGPWPLPLPVLQRKMHKAVQTPCAASWGSEDA